MTRRSREAHAGKARRCRAALSLRDPAGEVTPSPERASIQPKLIRFGERAQLVRKPCPSHALRRWHYAPVLPDGSKAIRKIRKPLILQQRPTVHGVVFAVFVVVPGYGWSGTSSVSERMMRSGLTVDPSGRPSPCTSIQIA